MVSCTRIRLAAPSLLTQPRVQGLGLTTPCGGAAELDVLCRRWTSSARCTSRCAPHRAGCSAAARELVSAAPEATSAHSEVTSAATSVCRATLFDVSTERMDLAGGGALRARGPHARQGPPVPVHPAEQRVHQARRVLPQADQPHRHLPGGCLLCCLCQLASWFKSWLAEALGMLAAQQSMPG